MKILFALLLFTFFSGNIIPMNQQALCSWCKDALTNETTYLLEEQNQPDAHVWNKDFLKTQCLHCKKEIEKESPKKYVHCLIGKHFVIHEACEKEFAASLYKLLICSNCLKKISIKFPDYCGLGREKFIKSLWIGFFLSAFIGVSVSTFFLVSWSPLAPAWMTNLLQ